MKEKDIVEESASAMFFRQYPQFAEVLPLEVLEMYLTFAEHCISKSRWKHGWQIGIGLFAAHFCTLYLQSMAGDTTASAVVSAGQTKGLVANKSVDGVSIGYDFSTALQGLSEWGGWTMTTYGTQLAMLAKLYGKGMWVVP